MTFPNITTLRMLNLPSLLFISSLDAYNMHTETRDSSKLTRTLCNKVWYLSFLLRDFNTLEGLLKNILDEL